MLPFPRFASPFMVKDFQLILDSIIFLFLFQATIETQQFPRLTRYNKKKHEEEGERFAKLLKVGKHILYNKCISISKTLLCLVFLIMLVLCVCFLLCVCHFVADFVCFQKRVSVDPVFSAMSVF